MHTVYIAASKKNNGKLNQVLEDNYTVVITMNNELLNFVPHWDMLMRHVTHTFDIIVLHLQPK